MTSVHSVGYAIPTGLGEISLLERAAKEILACVPAMAFPAEDV